MIGDTLISTSVYLGSLSDLSILIQKLNFTMKQHGGHEVKCRYVRCFSDLHALELHGLNAGIFLLVFSFLRESQRQGN